jgi:hypothetical protein
MNRKVLFMFLFVLMLNGLFAQNVSAVPLTVGQSSAWLTGGQEGTNVISTPSGSVICPTATFTGKTSGTSVNELTILPSYKNCTAFGFATAHVSTNGCTYTLTTPLSFGGGQVIWTDGFDQIHISCAVGKNIEITPTSFGVSVCTQYIGAQTPSGQIVGRSAGAFNEMDITLEFSWFQLRHHGTGGVCGSAEASDGKYSGNVTIVCLGNESHTFHTPCTFS